ncbi:uroporphyrinogen-III C-methyltransferase [Nitriliruptoraceae bacterium ZYF776]|nr:uroporphyrinogen-III C-methyltransferase [Profundirhabdus halotolerans]
MGTPGARRRVGDQAPGGAAAAQARGHGGRDRDRAGGRLPPRRLGPHVTPATVHLVGAGPGDPELLTVRAARLLGAADLVLADQLVPDAVLALARADAEVVPVGRRCGRVVVAHPAVVDRMVAAARAGRRVVRLKGGDPVVFGRGGEEVLELAARGVRAELVPGISSAIAAPELAGIPVTHRDLAGGFLVLTGRRAVDDQLDDADWDAAARFSGTVVVLMGAGRTAALCTELVARGRASTTPAAVVARAGRPDQQVVTGTLADLHERARDAQVGTPAVVVVGAVVEVLRATADAVQQRTTSTAACL